MKKRADAKADAGGNAEDEIGAASKDTPAWRLRELAVAAALHGSDSARSQASMVDDSSRLCMCGALRGAWICGMRLW